MARQYSVQPQWWEATYFSTATGYVICTTRMFDKASPDFGVEYDGAIAVPGMYLKDEYYFANGTPTLRPNNPATLNGNTLVNVPPGSSILLNDVEVESNVLTFDPERSTHLIRILSFPWREKSIMVTTE